MSATASVVSDRGSFKHETPGVLFGRRPTVLVLDPQAVQRFGRNAYYVLDAMLSWRARHDWGDGTVDLRADQLGVEVEKRWGVRLSARQLRTAKERLAWAGIARSSSKRWVSTAGGKAWLNTIFVRARRTTHGIEITSDAARMLSVARSRWGGHRPGAGRPRTVNQEPAATIKSRQQPPPGGIQDPATPISSDPDPNTRNGFFLRKNPRAIPRAVFPEGVAGARQPIPPMHPTATPRPAQALRMVKPYRPYQRQIPVVHIPPAPRFAASCTDDEIVSTLANHFCGAVGGQWRRKTVRLTASQRRCDPKVFKLLLNAGRQLQDLKIPPAAFVEESVRRWWHMKGGDDAVWDAAKKCWTGKVPTIPPVAWVFAPARLAKLTVDDAPRLQARLSGSTHGYEGASEEEIAYRQAHIDRMVAEGKWVWSVSGAR